jgi:hypothetical protein
MAVTGRTVEREYEPIVPWGQIQHAVNLMLDDPNQSIQTMKGKGWSVYRTAGLIRIDIQAPQGE